jgi:hypothetical protein
MRLWLSGPRLLHGLVRPGIPLGREDWGLPSWRKYELCRGLIKAAEARGEKMSKDEAAYIVDKALAVGAIDGNGNLNFHMRGTREEIIGAIMTVAKAWGFPLSQADAGSITDKAIRGQWLQITAAILSVVVIATLIYQSML